MAAMRQRIIVACLNTLFVVSLVAGQVTAAEITINPQATYLRTSRDDAPLSPAIFQLGALGISPGDKLLLQQLGDFDCGSPCVDDRTAMIGVFSSTAMLLTSDQPDRVPDAIDAGQDIVTSPTFFDSLPTDIPEDFEITDRMVVTPAGASYLFVAAHDSLYNDNSDPDGDFAVRIMLVPGLPGDYNGNGAVDAADYVLWRATLNSTTQLAADGNGNNIIDSGDYDFWRAYFGQPLSGNAESVLGRGIPEPTTISHFLGCGALLWWLSHCRRRQHGPRHPSSHTTVQCSMLIDVSPAKGRRLRACPYIPLLAVLTVCVWNCRAVNVLGAFSTFDHDDEGWRITGDAQGSSAIPTYHATGGNPGGYVSATDNVQGGVWYFKAPDNFHGDFAGAYGTSLQFDLRQSGINNQFNSVDIYLRGAGLELRFDTSYNPGTTWTNYQVTLNEAAGWTLAGTAPTKVQLLTVLGNITDLQIRGEYITGSDVGDLDNAYLVATSLPGDYNQNGSVDAADYVVWRDNNGTTHTLPNDPIGGTIGPPQYDLWRSQFDRSTISGGAVIATAIPEPTLLVLSVVPVLWTTRIVGTVIRQSIQCYTTSLARKEQQR